MIWKDATCVTGLLCTALVFARGQEPSLPPEQVSRSRGGASAPVVIHKVEPEYSEEARRARYQGTVELSVVVDENGEANSIRVVKRLGLGLDEKAVEAVKQWRFQPAMKDGRPVKVTAYVEVNFRLLLKGWNTGLIKFQLPDGVSPPVIDIKHFESQRPPVSGTVWLAFDVDEKGKPKNVRATRSSNPVLERAATASLRKWRFHPAAKDGQPISASGTVDLTFDPY